MKIFLEGAGVKRRAAAWTAAALLCLGAAGGLARADTAETPPPGGYLTGQLLVAAPKILSGPFRQTVIFVVHHDAHGALGLVVNRVVGEEPIARLLEEAGAEAEGVEGDIAIHFGGPVQPETGYILHSADYSGAGTVEVDDRFAMTTDPELLRRIGEGTGPRHALFALGYAGWRAGQLEDELERKSWYVAPADEAIVFDDAYKTKWMRALQRRSIAL